MLWFGERFEPTRVQRLAEMPLYTIDGDGYDGQFYAQLAVVGDPFDRELETSLDEPAYRTRRVLVPMLTHVVGLGRPGLSLAAYEFSNVVAWLILAVLLARWWFPPRDLHNLLRWMGSLFGVGMLISVSRGLVDGPALVLIAAGARAVEQGRHRVGAALLALAGLTRETSVLAAPALLPERSPRGARAWLRTLTAIGIVALPAALWIVVLRAHFGYLGGTRNLAPPLVGFAHKLRELRLNWRAGGFMLIRHELWVVVSLATQVAFVLARPQPREIWWRIGATFALFTLVLAWPVWEGNLSAAARTVQPLTLAFNVLAPRTRAGLALLLAGNLTLLSARVAYLPLPMAPDSTFPGGIIVTRAGEWHEREVAGEHSWRWAAGSGALRVRVPSGSDRTVTIAFGLSSVIDRTVVVRVGDAERRVVLHVGDHALVNLGPLRLPGGITTVTLTTAEAPWQEPTGRADRKLSFAVHNLSVR